MMLWLLIVAFFLSSSVQSITPPSTSITSILPPMEEKYFNIMRNCQLSKNTSRDENTRIEDSLYCVLSNIRIESYQKGRIWKGDASKTKWTALCAPNHHIRYEHECDIKGENITFVMISTDQPGYESEMSLTLPTWRFKMLINYTSTHRISVKKIVRYIPTNSEPFENAVVSDNLFGAFKRAIYGAFSETYSTREYSVPFPVQTVPCPANESDPSTINKLKCLLDAALTETNLTSTEPGKYWKPDLTARELDETCTEESSTSPAILTCTVILYDVEFHLVSRDPTLGEEPSEPYAMFKADYWWFHLDLEYTVNKTTRALFIKDLGSAGLRAEIMEQHFDLKILNENLFALFKENLRRIRAGNDGNGLQYNIFSALVLAAYIFNNIF